MNSAQKATAQRVLVVTIFMDIFKICSFDIVKSV